MKILLIEDNEYIIKGLVYLLEQHNFSVVYESSLKDARKQKLDEFDLIILDLMLPDGDGLTFYKNYIKGITPVIVLSAKDEEEQVVMALDSGIEDYIIKPFRSKELLSRINKILERNQKEKVIKINNLKFMLDTMQVYKDEEEINLTALELKILFLLLENHNRIVERDLIIDRIWDASGKFVNDNTLTVYIKRIREKLESEDLIKTIKGIGYRIDLWKRIQ